MKLYGYKVCILLLQWDLPISLKINSLGFVSYDWEYSDWPGAGESILENIDI